MSQGKALNIMTRLIENSQITDKALELAVSKLKDVGIASDSIEVKKDVAATMLEIIKLKMKSKTDLIEIKALSEELLNS